jgi:hypothetical protein
VCRIVETVIPLDSDFQFGKTYDLLVNDVKEMFVAQCLLSFSSKGSVKGGESLGPSLPGSVQVQ